MKASSYTTKLQYWQCIFGIGKKIRHIDQWNRIKSPEINLCIYGQLIYNKRVKNIHCGKESLLINDIGKTWQPHRKERNLATTLHHAFFQRKNSHMRRCSISLIMREMPIKTAMSYHLIPVRMAIMKKIRKNKCWWGLWRKEILCTLLVRT